MKGWKWLIGIVILLGIFVVATNLPNEAIVQNNLAQSVLEESDSKQQIPHEISKPTDSKRALPAISDLSIEELSELSRQYVVQCKDPYSFMDDYPEGAGREIQEKIFETWSKSSEFKQQLALAIMHTNLKAMTITGSAPQRKYEYTPLSQLVKDNPNSHLAHYFLISHCTTQKHCENSVFDSALVLDPYNGALWKLKAIREVAAGEVELALAAIENSIAAANYESYWGESIHMFEQALASTLELDALARRVAAIGYSAAFVMPDINILLNICREHSALRADIADACLRMGARQFLSGDSLFEQHIGLATQKIVYEQQKKILDVERIETQRKEFREATRRLSTATNLAMHDKNLNNYWWENILLYGETKALQLTYTEAVRLSSDPSYDPCPNGKIEPETISNQ